MISINDVHKTYGDIQALRGLSLTVNDGEMFGLLGPNGAGKSTLMHITAGLIHADGGEVLLAGRSVQSAVNRAKFLGFVPQEIALYADLTAWANIEIFGGLYGLRSADIKQRGMELLELVNLADRRMEKVKNFSGGMKRRLNLAVSLLHRPKCLLCDEPTVGVDPQSRNAIFEFLEEQNRQGLTIIYTTHYMEEVERLCDRIAIIDGGRLMACGSRDELLNASGKIGQIRLYECAPRAAVIEALKPLGTHETASGCTIFTPLTGFTLTDFAVILERHQFPSTHLEIRRPSLEQRFLELTGKELRE